VPRGRGPEGGATARGPVARGRDALGLLGFLALAFGALLAGGAAAARAPAGWYASLDKPFWTPPDWLFGPIWTLLYPAMALAGWRATRDGRSRAASLLFVLQLVLNAAWPWLFFALGRLDLAFYDAVLLFAAASGAFLAFWGVHRGAALLLLPYWGWVGFAAVLAHALFRLNTAS
jgi:tryptophan-rich sensory protein